MPDINGYNSFMNSISETEFSNAEAYDKALLTLSSVLLGFTLTFTQNVVTLQAASQLWMLLTSWFLFALTIVFVISSFLYVQLSYDRLREGARLYFLDDILEANNISLKIHKTVKYINLTSGILFILAVISFTLFVAINVYGDKDVAKENYTDQKSRPIPTYQEPKPIPVTQPKPQQQSNQQQNTNKK